MKKSLVILSLLVAGSTLFSSCNKKLKDDIKDLKQQVDELKKHNSELQEQVNGVENILGSNEPIIATTTFTDNNNTTRTVVGAYKFKAGNSSTQRMYDNGDGTYDIYIERFSDVEWYEGAWVAFTYNPTTKAVTNKRGGQYWNDEDPYYNNARYDENYITTGLTFSITVNSLNLATGEISLNFSASGTAEYTNAVVYYYVPNKGKPVSTTFSFTGKLKVFTQN
jgi:hypothetical protein